MVYKAIFIFFFFILMTGFHQDAGAGIDLATQVRQQSVRTTIYKNADITLVSDRRMLSFVKGMNQVQFSWANTRIDPTSLSIEIDKNVPGLTIAEITYPPGTKQMGIWHVKADRACRVPVRITYFTSGITWASRYTLILSYEMQTASVSNHIDVSNHSGEDYTDAHTRLVVGKIHLLDRIATLANRTFPYGRPTSSLKGLQDRKTAVNEAVMMMDKAPAMQMMAAPAKASQKPIKKKGLSEYFLYTVKGTQTIPDGWSKRLLSFTADKVKVQNIYRYDSRLYGKQTMRFISIHNNKKNNLGTTPLPPGTVTVFADTKTNGGLTFVGTAATQYIPVDKPLEVKLGSSRDISIVPTITAVEKSKISFDKNGNINGFEDIRKMAVTFSNFTHIPAKAEYRQHLETPESRITDISDPKAFQKTDRNTGLFSVQLDPHTTRQVTFTLTYLRGDRQWQ